MPNDMTPTRGYAFKDHSKKQPTKPLPGDRLDTEIDRILRALRAQTQYFTRTIAPDGTIIGQIITKENIKPDVLDYWVEQVHENLKSQIEKAQTAEKNTQNWLTQAKDHAQQAQEAQSQTEKLQSQSLSTLTSLENLRQDLTGSRSRAESAAQTSQIRAQDAQTSASSARISEDMAYRWAEKMDGPVFVPEGGDPVNDGFYSSKWWAIYTDSNVEFGSFWYLGPHPVPPTEGNGGVPLQEGMWYYDTTENFMYYWDGTQWKVYGAGAEELYVNVTGDTMTGTLEMAVSGNPAIRIDKGDAQTGVERIDFAHDDGLGGGGHDLTFRIQANRTEALTEALLRAYGANDSDYLQIQFSPDAGDVVLTGNIDLRGDLSDQSLMTFKRTKQNFPDVTDAVTYPYSPTNEKYIRFVRDHSVMGVIDLDDLSPITDPDWPRNQFFIRISTGTPLPGNGFPSMAAGDFIQSQSWGGGGAMQMGWDTSQNLMWLRCKSSEVWSSWVNMASIDVTDAKYQPQQSYLISGSDDLNSLGVANQHWRVFRLSGVPSNGFPNAGSGDWLAHYQYSSTAALQVAYNYNRSGSQVWSSIRKLQSGSWGEWEPAAFGLADIKMGFLNASNDYDDLPILANTTHKVFYVNVTGAANEPPDVDNGDTIVFFKVYSSTRAVQVHYPTTRNVGVQYRNQNSSGDWSPWKKVGEEPASLRMKWENEWAAGTYQQNDVVRQGVWTMVANTETSEQPVTEDVDPTWIGAGATIVPRGTENEATYWTGQKYTFTGGGYFEGYRIDPPVRNTLFEYSVIARVTLPDGEVGVADQVLAWQTFSGNPGEYIEVQSPPQLMLPDTTLEVWLGVRSVTISNTFTKNWDVKNDNGNPSAGEAWFQNNQTEIRVHDEDKRGDNQGDNLNAVTAGGTLQFAGTEWSITSVTDNGAFVTYGLTPLQGRPSEGERSLTFTWGSTDPLPVNSDATHWAGSANTRGIEGTDINNPTENDSQFPIDVLLRAITVSPDWDLVALSGSGGGGGGGTDPGSGSRATVGDTLPVNPLVGDLHYLTVDPVGLYVYYNDGDSLQWVQTNGGGTADDFVSKSGDVMTGQLSTPQINSNAQGLTVGTGQRYVQQGWANELGQLEWNVSHDEDARLMAWDEYVAGVFANRFMVFDGPNGRINLERDVYHNANTLGLTGAGGDFSTFINMFANGATGQMYLQYTVGTTLALIYTPDQAQYFQHSNNGYGYAPLGWLTSSSSRELKKDFKPITNALHKVKQLTGQTFKHKKNDVEQAGLIAEDVQAVLPVAAVEHVDPNTLEKNLTYDPQQVIALLVEAVKELTAEVETLKHG